MISVLISVYEKEKPAHFDLAMDSIYNQTFKDFEVVLVSDGPLTQDLYSVMDKWKYLLGQKMKVVYLEENMGVATALNEGLKHCSYDIVARMDSDDYCEPERLELQYAFMAQHPEIDVLGSFVSEFMDDVDRPVTIKPVPENHKEIVSGMWFRNPMNHMTVMFRKQSVLSVGGYEAFYGDDDHLWAKMYIAGCRFHNMNQCLVRVRVGEGMFKRRGVRWLVKDIRVRRYLFRNRKMNLLQLIFVICTLVVFRLMPTPLRKLLYYKIRQPAS